MLNGRSSEKISWLEYRYTSKDIFLFSFCLLCLNLLVSQYNGYVRGLDYPYNSISFLPGDRFADFFKVIDAFHVVKTWNGPSPYEGNLDFYSLPFFSIYYYFFAKLIFFTGNKYVVYSILTLALLVAHYLISKKLGNRTSAVFLSILSYPVIYAIDRGNYALGVYVAIFLALSSESILLSTLSLAVATSLKITPVVFILPIIIRAPSLRRTFFIIGSFLLFLLLINYLSVLFVDRYIAPHPFDISEFSKLVNHYYAEDMKSFRGLAFSSSLYLPFQFAVSKIYTSGSFSALKPIDLPMVIFCLIGLLLLLKDQYSAASKLLLLSLYLLAELLIFFLFPPTRIVTMALVGISYMGYLGMVFLNSPESKFSPAVLWAKVTPYLTFEKLVCIGCFSFILFMPVTADYYLLIAFIPLLLFPFNTYSFGYFVIYGLLLGAKNFWYLPGEMISLQSFINPVLLLLLVFSEFDLLSFSKRFPILAQGKHS